MNDKESVISNINYIINLVRSSNGINYSVGEMANLNINCQIALLDAVKYIVDNMKDEQ